MDTLKDKDDKRGFSSIVHPYEALVRQQMVESRKPRQESNAPIDLGNGMYLMPSSGEGKISHGEVSYLHFSSEGK